MASRKAQLAYTSMLQMQQMSRFSMSQSQHGCRHHSEDSPTQHRPPRTGISQLYRVSLTAYPLWKGSAHCLATGTLRFFPRFVRASQPALITISPAVTHSDQGGRMSRMSVTSCLYVRAIGKAQSQLCCKSSLRRKRRLS